MLTVIQAESMYDALCVARRIAAEGVPAIVPLPCGAAYRYADGYATWVDWPEGVQIEELPAIVLDSRD